MNRALKAVLYSLLGRKIIGKRHTSEKRMVNSKTKWLNKAEKREFKREYKKMIDNSVILRSKKRTKKSATFHISLNPKKVSEVGDML